MHHPRAKINGNPINGNGQGLTRRRSPERAWSERAPAAARCYSCWAPELPQSSHHPTRINLPTEAVRSAWDAPTALPRSKSARNVFETEEDEEKIRLRVNESIQDFSGERLSVS